MATKCKECVFKDVDGGKYPCNECSEIMDLKSMKCKENYFEQINEHYIEFQKDIESRKRLRQKLSQIMAYTNKKIIYTKYGDLEDGKMMLTAFLNDGKNIIIYQIIDTGTGLVKNVVSVDRGLLHKINEM